MKMFPPMPFQPMTLHKVWSFPLDPPVLANAMSSSVDGQHVLIYGPKDDDGHRTISWYDRDGDRFVFRDSARYQEAADGSLTKVSS